MLRIIVIHRLILCLLSSFSWLDVQTLSAADLRDHEISALVAAKMREFHDLEMPGPRTVLLWNRMRYRYMIRKLKVFSFIVESI